MERQRRLTNDTEPLHLTALIEESVLDRPIDSAATMRAQLEHLIEISGRDNVELLVLPTATEQWSAWLAEVTTDRLTNTNGAVIVTVGPDAWTVRSLDTGHTLVFDDNEWTAFRLGATDGEFDPTLALELAST
jgi:hypothetical protein